MTYEVALKWTMPVSKQYAEFVSERLGAVRPVRIKPMFGGLGIYHQEAFFAVADDDRLYFKVSPESVADYDGYGMGPWIMGGQENLKYREVPGAVLESDELLGQWIDVATEATVRLSRPRPKKKG